MFGVSEKTIRRRIKAGELTASKQPLDGGGISWRVQIGGAMDTGVDNVMDNQVDRRRNRDGQRAGTPHAQSPTAMDTDVDKADNMMDSRAGTAMDSVMDTGVDTRGVSLSNIPLAISQDADRAQTNHEVELLRVQLDSARAEADREREFSALLKSQLEAVTQSEATTKAALREALRAMPKALPSATDATPIGNTAPEMASGAPLDAQANKVPTDDQAPGKSPATRAPRPLWKIMFGVR